MQDCKLTDKRKRLYKTAFDKVYGIIPDRPKHLQLKFISEDRHFAAGDATLREFRLIFDFGTKKRYIHIRAAVPNREGNHPVIVFLSDNSNIPGKYLPAEDIIKRGYAIVLLDCTELTPDSADFKKGACAGVFGSRRKKNAPGKLAIWAWGAMRVIDSLQEIKNIDSSKITIAAHSKLGQAALISAAADERINCVIANDCINLGSPVGKAEICEAMPYLFCPRYAELISTSEAPDGYRTLLELCSDKIILIGSTDDDPCSSPDLELEAINALVKSGIPKERIFLRIRRGSHYLSVDDWKAYLDFIRGI